MVPAVLLMVLVTVLSLVAISSRVASSRQEAAQGAMANAAREAAEYGFSEIVAEMNRDVNSHRWVTSFANGSWQAVDAQDLSACGVKIADTPGTFPASADLPNNRYGQLSYELQKYDPPVRVSDPGPDSNNPVIPAGHPCADVYNQLGNLLGGSGTLAIQGKAKSPNGQVTTYVLKRNVSVRRKPPIEAVNSLWGTYPTSSDLVELTVKPSPYAGVPSGITPAPFNLPPLTSARLNKDLIGGPPWTWTDPTTGQTYRACDIDTSASPPILRCWFTSVTISAGADLKVDATDLQAVEIYISGSGAALNVADGGDLYQESPLNWSRLRIFGQQSGNCASPQQEISLALSNSQLNLRNAFIRFPSGRVDYTANSLPTGNSILAGIACGAIYTSLTAAQVGTLQSIFLSGSQNASSALFSGLGGPYGFSSTGIFAGANPIRFTYRGVGFSDS